jgi:hypothetical protein
MSISLNYCNKALYRVEAGGRICLNLSRPSDCIFLGADIFSLFSVMVSQRDPQLLEEADDQAERRRNRKSF